MIDFCKIKNPFGVQQNEKKKSKNGGTYVRKKYNREKVYTTAGSNRFLRWSWKWTYYTMYYKYYQLVRHIGWDRNRPLREQAGKKTFESFSCFWLLATNPVRVSGLLLFSFFEEPQNVAVKRKLFNNKSYSKQSNQIWHASNKKKNSQFSHRIC